MTNAIIYARFSPCPDAEECNSNVYQIGRCKIYCERKGYNVIAEIKDNSVSGRVIDRPGLNEAIESLQPGMVLVVDRNDRLARDMLVALTIHARVESLGCSIEFADGSPLRSTAEGELLQNILSALAQFERRKFAERTKAGLARKKASGVYCGRPPYGWRKEKNVDKLIPIPDEQAIIECILRKKAIGHTSEFIADFLNEIGDTCRGKKWSDRTIRKIIAREKKKTLDI